MFRRYFSSTLDWTNVVTVHLGWGLWHFELLQYLLQTKYYAARFRKYNVFHIRSAEHYRLLNDVTDICWGSIMVNNGSCFATALHVTFTSPVSVTLRLQLISHVYLHLQGTHCGTVQKGHHSSHSCPCYCSGTSNIAFYGAGSDANIWPQLNGQVKNANHASISRGVFVISTLPLLTIVQSCVFWTLDRSGIVH